MTYEEIIQHVGRQIEKEVYYYDNNNNKIDVNVNHIENAKPKFNCSLTGTVMKGLELELKEELPNTAIYFKNVAKYGSYTAEKLYAPYYFKEKPTYNADKKTYTHILYDEFIKTMVDYSPINISYPCTLFSYFSTLVSTLGYTTNIQSLPNGDKILLGDVFDGINYTYRDVFEDIGNATGTLFEIDGTIIKKCSLGTSNNMAIVDDDILKNANINFGEHFGPINTIVLSRSGDSDNVYIEDEELVARDGRKEFKIRDSQLMNDNNREEYLEELLEALKGIEYDIFDTELVGYGGFIPLQKVKFETGSNNYYSYVFNNEIEITQGYKETIYTDMPDEAETNYKCADTTDKRINQAYILVDKQNQKITSLTNEVSEHEEKITIVEQTVDGISQEVDSMFDFVREMSSRGSITLNDCAPGNLLYLSIKGAIELLYPKTNLYPSTQLYPLETYLVITDEEGNKNRVYLPINYLHVLDNVYDEFIIDGSTTDSQAYIIRRIGINENNELYVLTEETIEQLGKIEIPLTNGKNILSLASFPYVFCSAKYAVKNDYTDTFATKLELSTSIQQTNETISFKANRSELANYATKTEVNSAITQKADEINIEVNKKVNNSEFGTKIRQNSESVQYAWNQIDESIQFEEIDGNASISIYDDNDNLLMNLDKDGQKFYDNSNHLMGAQGREVQSLEEQPGVTNTYVGLTNYIKYGIGDFIRWAIIIDPDEGISAEGLSIIEYWMRNGPDTYKPSCGLADDSAWIRMVAPLLVTEGIQTYGNIYNMFDDYYISSNKYFNNLTSSLKHLQFVRGGNSDTDFLGAVPDGSNSQILFPNYQTVYELVISDEKLKTNIVDCKKSALEDVKKIKVKEFDWKDSDIHESIGFIAQQLNEIDETYVNKMSDINDPSDTTLGLNLKSLIALCIKSIQEQQIQIENLTKVIEEMRKNET